MTAEKHKQFSLHICVSRSTGACLLQASYQPMQVDDPATRDAVYDGLARRACDFTGSSFRILSKVLAKRELEV